MSLPDFTAWLSRRPAGPKPRKRVRRVSSKRQREAKAYSLLRAAYLQAHPKCQAWGRIMNFLKVPRLDRGVPAATEIHHTAGRTGGNYLNTDTWLAVSREAHVWIHNNGNTARKLGLLQ